MADVNANIGVSIDTSQALAQLKSLQRQISQFHTSIARSSEAAALAQRSLQKNLINSINSIGAFSAELRTVRTSAESFTNSLEKNKFSMREYFRYAGASTRTFGKLFKSEFDTIGKVAEERVKTLQTQYIKLGRNASGAMEAIAVRPTALNMQDYGTKTAIAAQKQALFNQLMKQGTTNLLNFGKNTQWAGRQLMVGFTIPLSLVASTASKTFMEMEAQTLKFRKVYGDLFTPKAETQAALDSVIELGRQFTKYGVAVSQTVALSAEAAAAGFQGLDLQRQTTEATRLSVLGQIDSQKALETTISLQNAFGMSSENLADSINFLNAVENQTVVSLDDITTAIPKVAPVIQQLGGDVKDLTFFIAAMKEGGINASEGANALKSGLAALINPTNKASDMLKSFGINATAIIEKNKGNLKATVIEFANALNTLDPLSRARAIEQMFGKFQFARLSTLFANVAKDGNQAARVLDLANASVEELSALSEQELGMTADSAMNKFRKSVEDLKLALVPVGQAFLEAATPIVEFVGGVLEKFGNLSDGTKRLITLLTVGIGAVGPIFLMTFGLLANGLANTLKGALILRQGYLKLTGQSQVLGEQTQYLNSEQLDAAAAAHSLDQTHAKLTQTFNVETQALGKLIAAYQSASTAARNFAFNNPGMMLPGRAAKKFANGIVSVPGPKGAGDIVPAMLSPGEAVIPSKMVQKYAPLINGMVADNIPGYQKGKSLGTAVDVPGGMDVSHFGLKSSSTGAELLAMVAGLETTAANNVRKMVESFENGLTRVFTTFNNQVIAQFTEINRSMQYQGKASTEKVRQNLIGAGFAETRDIELQRQLLQSGVSIDEFKLINKQITDEIIKGFDALGDKTEITSEELNNLLRKAYEEVAKTDARVEKAYNNMKKISSVVNPDKAGVRGSRLSITEDSYLKQKKSTQKTPSKYKKMQAQMVGAENIPYAQSSRFVVTHNVAKELNITSKQAAAIYEKMSIDAKVTLSRMRNDLTAFKKEFIIEAAKVGEIVGTSAVNATAKAAGTASPSKKTISIGQDIARGLEQGMNSRQKNVAQAGNNLSTAAIRAAQSQAQLYGTTTVDAIQKSYRRQQEKLAKAASKIIPDSSQENKKPSRFANIRGMGGRGLAGIGGATMAASMLPGKAGEIGMKVGSLAFVAQSLAILPGPLKLVAVAFGGLYGITKLLAAAKEKERLAIEGIGKAANLSSTQIEKLGGILGFTPLKSNLELSKPAISGLSVEKSKQVEETRKLLAEDSDFKNQVSGLKNATNEQADIIFKSLALRLTGQGATKEQITNYIYALQQEAGKTDVKFDLKSIDLSTKEGQAGLQNSVDTLLKDYKTAFDKGYKKTKVLVGGGRGGGVVKEVEVLSKDLKTQLSTTANVISNTFMSLDTQLRSGKINADQFNQSFDNISNSINSMPKAEGLFLMGEILKTLPSDLAKSASGLKDTSNQLLIVKSAALGVAVSAEMIQALLIAETDKSADAQIRASTIKAELEQKMKVAQKVIADIVKKSGGGTGGAKETDDLTKKINAMQDQIKVFNLLVSKQIAYKDALEISNDASLREIILNAQKAGTLDKVIPRLQKLLGLQTSLNNIQDKTPITDPEEILNLQEKVIDIRYRSSIQQEEAAVKNAEKVVNDIEKEIDSIENSIEKKRRNIEILYDRPIQALQDEGSILSNNLKIIDTATDQINKKYDTQISALEKISSINQEIANQEKSRLDIASALTSGDVAAAAQAVQDARAQAAASQFEKQKAGLEASRQQEIAGLTAGGMTKDQISQRQLAIEQQIFNLEQQKNAATVAIRLQEDQIYSIQKEKLTVAKDSLVAAQDALQKINDQKDADLAFINQKKQFFADQKTLQAIANADVTQYETKVAEAEKTAKNLLDKILGLNTTVETVHVIRTINVSGPGSTPIPGSGSGTYRAKMYGGKILPMNMGGMVPKYFASGGRIGSDTVPTMLTPGEFVMNKRATQQFGPLLSMLNESKYPSMIGPSYSGAGMKTSTTKFNNNSKNTYNYNVGITVGGTNASADNIARAVMGEIKYLDAQRIRGQRAV